MCMPCSTHGSTWLSLHPEPVLLLSTLVLSNDPPHVLTHTHTHTHTSLTPSLPACPPSPSARPTWLLQAWSTAAVSCSACWMPRTGRAKAKGERRVTCLYLNMYYRWGGGEGGRGGAWLVCRGRVGGGMQVGMQVGGWGDAGCGTEQQCGKEARPSPLLPPPTNPTRGTPLHLTGPHCPPPLPCTLTGPHCPPPLPCTLTDPHCPPLPPLHPT